MGQVIAYNPINWVYMQNLHQTLKVMEERNVTGRFRLGIQKYKELFTEAKQEYLDS